jgi:hypothetical protein
MWAGGMPNLFVPIFFLLFSFVDLSEAGGLPKDPVKMYHHCHALISKPKFITAYNNLHEKIPVAYDRVWNKTECQVDYDELLSALYGFMAKVRHFVS